MKIVAVILHDLRQLLRDKGSLASLFLMPLAFILPVSIALGSGDGYGISRDGKPALPVVIYDRGVAADAIEEGLEESFFLERWYDQATAEKAGVDDPAICADKTPSCTEAVARQLVAKKNRRAAVIIPEGFSRAVENGDRATLTMLFNPAADVATQQLYRGILEGVATKLSIENRVERAAGDFSSLMQFTPQEGGTIATQPEVNDKAGEQIPAIVLEKVSPSSSRLQQLPNTYQQTVPGYTVMFVFFIIEYLFGVIQAEKDNRTFRRLMSMPVKKGELLAGKMLAAFVIGIVQVGILFSVGHYLFGMGLGRDPAGLIMVTVALVAAATGIGLAASTTKIGRVIVAPLIVAALLGGCMFPLDIMPGFLRTLSYFVPHSWALAGYQNLIVREMGFVDVLPQIGVLLLFAGVFFIIAVRRLEFE